MADYDPVVWTCPTCGSARVQSPMWVDANTGQALNDLVGGYHWCEACEEQDQNGEKRSLEQQDWSKCREGQALAELEALPCRTAEQEVSLLALRALRACVLLAKEPALQETPHDPRS